MELGYWNFQGKAEVIRICLAYFKIPYIEKNPVDYPEALRLLGSFNFNFLNLPHLINRDIRITESRAIPIYLAYKSQNNSFFGGTREDYLNHKMLTEVLYEIESNLFKFFSLLITWSCTILGSTHSDKSLAPCLHSWEAKHFASQK